jgi:hypothetical protein
MEEIEKPLSPSSDGTSEGRDNSGRFTQGNRFGRGNPNAKRVAQFRKALISAVSPIDIWQIIQALVEKAKQGDTIAAREVLDRTVGRVDRERSEPEFTPLAVRFVTAEPPVKPESFKAEVVEAKPLEEKGKV